jgi:hypothetical protein
MKFFQAIFSILESIGQARAAAHLARTGRMDEARKLYQI